MKQQIKIGGLSCDACQKVIQKRIAKIAGVEDVNVEANGSTMIMVRNKLTKNDLEKALSGTSYKILEV